jgi:TusA-related sulfurtransferase
MAEIHLDALGEMCPFPIIKSEKIFKTMSAGDKLVVTTDHSCAMKSVPLHFKKLPALTEVTHVARGIWEIIIEKTA